MPASTMGSVMRDERRAVPCGSQIVVRTGSSKWLGNGGAVAGDLVATRDLMEASLGCPG